jgi:SAM-dependent methyltransferase
MPVERGARRKLIGRAMSSSALGFRVLDRDAWNDRYRTAELVWSVDANQFVVAETADLRPGRALDLAAGEGRNAIWLAERGWAATAVDFSDVALDKAAALASARGVALETVVADVTRYEPPEAEFDLVLVAYLQLPEAERRAVFGHAAGALAPGGTLVIVAHDRANLDGGYGGPTDASVLTTPTDVAAALTGCGLVVEKATTVERSVETPDGARTAIDHVVRAHR